MSLLDYVLLILMMGICQGQDPPVIHGIPDYVTKGEDFPNGTKLFNFTATHPQNRAITIRTLGDMTDNIVYIQQTTGGNISVQVITKSELDRDGDGRGYPGSGRFDLRFSATDTSGNEILLRTTLFITDINDNHPILANRPYSWEIPELPYNVSEVYRRVKATDLDSGNFGTTGLRYYMEPMTQSPSTADEYRKTFGMDERTGEVRLKKSLDYETNSYYQFHVTARDDRGNGNTGVPADLIIRVLDVQDTPPFFTGQPYRSTIRENVNLNTDVIKGTARDGDTGVSNQVNYTILQGNCSTLFNISSDGDIRTSAEIDRDSGDVYAVSGVCVLNVLVQEEDADPDKQYGNTTAITEVTITVDDENDNAPEFVNETYNAEIHENTPHNVPITLLNQTEIIVFDIDQGINAELELSLKYPNGTECNDFSISPTRIQKSGSALIRVANQNLLDYETIRCITFLIVAKEKLGKNRPATATVSLSILDMNDNNPQFDNSSYSFSIPENSNNNTSVGIITATDADSGDFGNISYSISGGNNRFVVGKYTGVIYTSCTTCHDELDREKVDVYYMTYTATDFGGRSNSTSLVIHITDVNDNAPEFTRQTYSNFIDENDARYNVTPVIELEANDRDEITTNNSRIVYKILALSENQIWENISIDDTDGKLYLDQPVDFEKLDNKSGIIEIVVEARDLGDPSKANNATVKLTVQDVNDNRPAFNGTRFHAEVTENSTSDASTLTSFGRVYASDADGTERNSKIQFFIISGAMDHFTMNPNTGVVSVQINAKLDREAIPYYNITIAAIDQGSPPLSGTTTLLVELIDVNDEMPAFNDTEYIASVLENQTDSINTTFITCLATDPDVDNDIRYSIVGHKANDEDGIPVNITLVEDYFYVDEHNGSVYITSLPDREVAKTITLTIQAEDINAYHPKRQTAEVGLTITLLDINDNPPEFQEQSYNVSVSENAQGPTILLTIIATDRDEHRTIKYELGAESGSFDIHPDTGVLRKNGPLDREENDFIVLQINATDNGEPSLGSSTNVFVTVLDFNDNSPDFVNFTHETNVTENATTGSFVLKVTATDDDIGPNKNVTYGIEEGADGKFVIDPISGNITVADELDRELKDVYTLIIKAQDNPLDIREQKNTFETLTITILDVNDNHPQFENIYYPVRILERADIDSSVAQVVAHDADEPSTENKRISYFFSNDTSPSSLFRINADSGVVYVNKSLVGYAGTYVLGLVAEDNGEPRLRNESAVVNITVLDENLNRPVITNLPVENKIKVYECVDTGHEIYHFNFSDADTGINALADFNISEIDDVIFDTFEIETNGILRVIKKLNALDKDSYRFQVQVTDRGTPALSSDKETLIVEVIDVDDHLPSFTEPSVSFNIKENQPTGEVVGTLSAEDKDQDSIACYYIKDDESKQIFDIGRNNGSIITKTVLDYENKTSYMFTVRVEDCSIDGNASGCENFTRVEDDDYRDTVDVYVNVTDVNDNPPVFRVDEISVGMKRTTEVNVSLDISLKTGDYIDDKDTDIHGRQAWVFSNGGKIQTSSSLNDIGALSGVMKCPRDQKQHIVCVSGNGSLINNKYYSEDISGYFIVPVNVSDAAGSDSVNVKIFLIGDSQILVMTLLGPKETIAEKKNEIMELYTQVTGYEFVYDWLEDHKTPGGSVETFKTDLYFHVVDKETDRVLSAKEGIRIVDSNYERLLQAMQLFDVLQIESSVKEIADDDNSIRTVYILAAVIAVLTLTVAIIVYVSITTRNTYKRKLRAATVKPNDIKDVTEKSNGAIPGSNMYSRQANPLLNKDIPEKIEYDNMSMGSHNSLDANSVGEPRGQNDYDQLEEREVRMNMYMEEENTSNMESPLDAALKHYDTHNIHNKQDNVSTEEIVSPHDVGALAFENTAYIGEFESTEI